VGYNHYPLADELAAHLRAEELQRAEEELPDLASYGARSPPSPNSLNSFPVTNRHRGRHHNRSPEYWTMEVATAPPESRGETSPESQNSPMDVPQSPIVHSLPPDDDPPEEYALGAMEDISTPVSNHKLGKLGSLGFGKRQHKWGLSSVFGHGRDNHQPNTLPPVDELNVSASASRSMPTLKRSQSGSTGDGRSVQDMPTGNGTSTQMSAVERKKLKKEQERIARDAEKARRAEVLKEQRERARAVMYKNQMMQRNLPGEEFHWLTTHQTLNSSLKPINALPAKGKQRAEPRLPPALEGEDDQDDWLSHRSKARRRDLDDDHSMSSSEVHSISRMSMISFASGDSDPGPTRTMRVRPAHNVYNIPRAISISSLRTSSGRGFSPSARSSNSMDHQFVREFHERATLNFDGQLSDTGSPPPLHDLSLSPTQTHSQWPSGDRGHSPHPHMQDPRYSSLPPISSLQPPQSYDRDSSPHPQDSYHPAHTVNPMFQVVSYQHSHPIFIINVSS